MIFQKLTLFNLFSYYGEQVFDFSQRAEGQNIDLIAGANGRGKTSLLNAVKLLFAGPHQDMFEIIDRPGSQRKRRVTLKQYVHGASDEWMGIFNRRAKNEKNASSCYIELVWLEDSGQVTVRRTWQRGSTGSDLRGELKIVTDFEGKPQNHIDPDECESFLNHRLPKDYLSFFFFDGEQIMQLAESTGSEQVAQIEKILDLTALDLLRTSLKRVKSRYTAQQSPSAQSDAFQALKRAIQQLKTQLLMTKQRDVDLQCETAILTSEKDLLSAEIPELQKRNSRQASIVSEKVGALKRADSQLNDDRSSFYLDIIPKLPLLAHHASMAGMKERIHESEVHGATNIPFLNELKPDLQRIFETSPHPKPRLIDQQIEHLKQRVSQFLDNKIRDIQVMGEEHFEKGGFFPQGLLSEIDPYSAPGIEAQAGELLNRIGKGEREVQELEAEVARLRENQPTTANVDSRAQKKSRLEKQIQANQQKLASLPYERRTLNNELKSKQEEARRLEEKLEKNELIEKKNVLIDGLDSIYKQAKQNLKSRYRIQFEKAINEKYKILCQQRQVARIGVDKNFALHYFNESDAPVGRLSISAGTKQLVVIALLWALKDTSGKDIPLVIDTPLSRLDLSHQKNVLQHYYPKAGKQVILLPTDSELDQEKYAMIKGNLANQFKLENATGEATEIKRHPMH